MGYQGLNSQVKDGDAIQKFGYMYIHGDFLWNMSNALSGYKETRFWNLVPYLHAGFYRSDGIENVDVNDNEFAVGAGLLHNLRMTDRLDLIIDMKAIIVDGSVHGASGAAVVPSVTMGVAVDLGWPNFVRTSSVIAPLEAANAEKVAIIETAMVALEAANVVLEKENMMLAKKNNELSKQVKNLQNVTVKDEGILEGLSPLTVYFEIGSAVLNDKEMQHLDFYASKILDKVSDGKDVIVTVMGTADSNTGTQKRNQHLSEARGKYIENLLTEKYGIDQSRITVISEIIKADSKPDLSRSVKISF
jgi:outer membrane protein OmpA-like peptidoglycan-associated protein